MYLPVFMNLIVERDLRTGRDRLHAEKSDAQLSVHRPILRLRIRITRVIDELRYHYGTLLVRLADGAGIICLCSDHQQPM